VGTLYSRRHLVEPRTASESKRARVRLGAKASDLLYDKNCHSIFARTVSSELGTEVPSGGMGLSNIQGFFEGCSLRDMLDAVTLVHDALTAKGWEPQAAAWSAFAERVMREEGLVFTVQKGASVTNFVDEAFAASGGAVVAMLDNAKYGAASAALVKSLREINSLDGSAKNAVRDAFEAAEICFKVATETNANLGEREVTATLAPKVDALYQAGDPVTRRVAGLIVQAMKDWINAAHPYRHGHDEPEPVEPSREIAIALVALAIAHMRFIAEHFPP
jgi:hypothetical protein